MKPIPYHKETFYSTLEINGIHTLFTSLRIERESLPKGVFAYDIRESDDGNHFSTIEKQVCVNHAGTILTFQEIPIPKEGYANIEDYCFGPDEELSFNEFKKEIEKPSRGILPKSTDLLEELKNGLRQSYDNELCPDCEGALIYEIDDALIGKELTEQYRCPECDYTCSTDEYHRLLHKVAMKCYKRVCKEVCNKFDVNYYTANSLKNSPFEEEIIDTIIERISSNNE